MGKSLVSRNVAEIGEIKEKLEYLTREVEILNSIEHILSDFIAYIASDGIDREGEGYVYLHRGVADFPEEQAAFAIEYVPAEKERKECSLAYGQSRIAIGDFLKRQIGFREIQANEKYLEVKVIPALKELFSKMGFQEVFLKPGTRSWSVIFRFGGEEFLISS